MALIKIYPSFGDTSERNIQAKIVGQVYGLNLWLHDCKQVDVYIEVPLHDKIYLRAGSIYNRPYVLSEELDKIIEQVKRVYSSAEDIKAKQLARYSEIWSKMTTGELVNDRSGLRNYNYFCAVFGPIVTHEEFNNIWKTLNEKWLTAKAIEKESREEKNRQAELKRREEKWAAIEVMKQKVREGKDISGDELLWLIEVYNLYIPIRTKGMFMEKLTSVNERTCTGRFKSGQKLTNHPSGYYKEIRAKIAMVADLNEVCAEMSDNEKGIFN